MQKGFLFFTTLFYVFNIHAITLPQYLNFDGQLLNSSDQPITSATSVVFEIYDPSGNCLLYKETQTITPDTYGEFSTKIGPSAGGTASTNDGDISWPTIFQNDSQVRSSDPTFCVGGYTPAAGDSRKLRVTVAGNILTPDYVLAPVPSATVAETLQGKVPNDFLASAPASGNAALNANLQIENGQSLKLGNATSPSTNFVSLKAPSSFTSYILTLPVDDGTAGQVLTTDGSGLLSWTTPSGGGAITSVFGRTGAIISAAGDYSASQITNTAAGNIAATDIQTAINELDSEKLSTAGGSMVGPLSLGGNIITGLGTPAAATDAATKNYVDTNVSSISGTQIVDGTIATIDLANGSVTDPKITSMNVSKITNGVGSYLAYAPNGTNCANGEILTWNSVTGWECGVPNHGNFLGLANDDHPQYAHLSGRPGGQTLFGGNMPLDDLIIESTSDASRGNILLHPTVQGNVGIGTTTPTVKLEVYNSSTGASAMKVKSNAASQPAMIIDALQTSAPALDVRVNTVSKMFITNTGVGIGTTAPIGDLDVNISGVLKLKKQISGTPPAVSCAAPTEGAVALTFAHVLCVCNGTNWVKVSDGSTLCTW